MYLISLSSDWSGGRTAGVGYRTGWYGRPFRRWAGLRVRRRLFDGRADDTGGVRAWPGVRGDPVTGRHDGSGRDRLRGRRRQAAGGHGRGLPQLLGELHGVRAHQKRDSIRGLAQGGRSVRESGERVEHIVS